MNRLRPLTFFPPVEPFGAAAVGRLDRLAIHPQRLRLGRNTSLDADLLAEDGVNLVPGAVQTPVTEQPVDGLPGREVVGHHPPRSPGPQVVEDRVDHCAAINGNRPTALGRAGLGLRQQRVEAFPLLVGQVGRVRLPTHGPQK